MPHMMQSSIENQMISQMLRGATITDSKEQVAQKVSEPDGDDRWDVLVIGCVWKNGQKIFEARRTDLSDVVILRQRVVVQ